MLGYLYRKGFGFEPNLFPDETSNVIYPVILRTYPSMKMEQTEPNLFPYKYPNILYPVILRTYPPMKMEKTECSETSAYKIQTQGNYPEENIQHICSSLRLYKGQQTLQKSRGSMC